jgi:hypothetical protein
MFNIIGSAKGSQINERILRRSGEGEKGRCLPWSKEEDGAYTFWMKQVPVDTLLPFPIQTHNT